MVKRKTASRRSGAARRSKATARRIFRPDAEQRARRGIIPRPDFSAKTHRGGLARLRRLQTMIRAGDVKGLKAFQIDPVHGTRRALAKYRDLAIIALEARR